MTVDSRKILIRHATDSDADIYRELRLEALRDFPEAFSSEYEENLAQPPEFWAEAVKVDRGDRAVHLFLAFEEAVAVGNCAVFIPRRSKLRHNAWIVGMYVRPNWRGRGIAGRLMETCLAAAKEAGATVAKLAVAGTNSAAVRCYFNQGFHVYGTEPSAVFWNGTLYDDLLMYRILK